MTQMSDRVARLMIKRNHLLRRGASNLISAAGKSRRAVREWRLRSAAQYAARCQVRESSARQRALFARKSGDVVANASTKSTP